MRKNRLSLLCLTELSDLLSYPLFRRLLGGNELKERRTLLVIGGVRMATPTVKTGVAKALA